MNIMKIFTGIIKSSEAVNPEKLQIQKQINRLRLQSAMDNYERANKVNFKYPYSQDLAPVIISEKAQVVIDKLVSLMEKASEKVHNQVVNLDEGKNINFLTSDYPVYDAVKNIKGNTLMRISRRDPVSTTSPILTFDLADLNGEQKEMVRVCIKDVPEAGYKKGQVLKYENRENYYYKKDVLYPRRNFDTVEQQSAGHPLLLKRINSLIVNLFGDK